MKKNKFIFDVDGTLTISSQPINNAFAEWFLDFCKTNDAYLFSSSYDTTIEQLGSDICAACNTVFSCSANDTSQILKHFNAEDKIYLFANNTDLVDNDYTLAKKLKHVYTIRNWRETWETLLYFKESGIAA